MKLLIISSFMMTHYYLPTVIFFSIISVISCGGKDKEGGHTIIVKSDGHHMPHFEPFPVPVPVPVPIFHKHKSFHISKGIFKHGGIGGHGYLKRNDMFPGDSSLDYPFNPYSSFGMQYPGFGSSYPSLFYTPLPQSSVSRSGTQTQFKDEEEDKLASSSNDNQQDRRPPLTPINFLGNVYNPGMNHIMSNPFSHPMIPTAGITGIPISAFMTHPVFIPATYPMHNSNAQSSSQSNQQRDNSRENTRDQDQSDMQSYPQSYHPQSLYPPQTQFPFQPQYYSWPHTYPF